MNARPLAAVAAVAILSLPAHAQAANRDLRCLMISTMFAEAAPVAQAKEAAAQARLFYLGRVSGKLVAAQLAPAMAIEARTIDPDHAGPEMNKCLATVQASAAAIIAAGRKAQASTRPAASRP